MDVSADSRFTSISVNVSDKRAKARLSDSNVSTGGLFSDTVKFSCSVFPLSNQIKTLIYIKGCYNQIVESEPDHFHLHISFTWTTLKRLAFSLK